MDPSHDPSQPTPTIDDIRAAAGRILGHAQRTPVMTCDSLDRRLGCRLFLKCENLQKVGAFKFRGACNAVFALPDGHAARGVACHSSGNHAQALALAARMRGVPAYIVMPRTAPAVKRAAVEGYGGRVTPCEPTLAAREETLAKVVAETGAVEIHPFNNPFVIAGQGTVAMELLADVPDLDAIVAPVGGGGLMSGTAIAATALKPGIRVIGAEPANADDAAQSMAEGRIMPPVGAPSIADGLLTSLGTLTFAIIREKVQRIVTASEESIVAAMRFAWERTKLVVEPSAAVPLAAMWEGRLPELRDARVGVILSGGNVALDKLPWQA